MRIYTLRIITFILIIIAWYGLSCYINNAKLFPNPSSIVLESIPAISNFNGPQEGNHYVGTLWVIGNQVWISAKRIFLGLIIGLSLGFIFGLVIHYSHRYSKGNLLILKFFRGIPLLTLIPLFICWFGGTNIGIITYISFATFTIFAMGTYEAVLNVPETYLEQSRILGGSEWQTYQYIIANAIMPELLGTIVNIVGLIWAISLAAEYLSSSSGLGTLVVQSYDNDNMGQLIVLMIVYCILGLISCFAVRKTGKLFIH